ncbi:competence protein TfoX [Anaerotruncus sp. AF02-27]|uniref:TfoX/Sxy family protein n=1 Tax=Anaerotruncus sp. AF02-27 TaxID=2292191 RepID=UPI000E546EBE|nr:TfoX/Sxy family protein [Anaerotruncus sp. AF02-27]RGX57018.1 competence protein TfoX [Anaerotruncus sp. AF02-27]
MGELAKLPNIGKTLEQQLLDAGIDSPDELRRVGSREAWLRIQAFDPSACLHRLSALEGAIRGVRKAELDEGVKAQLKQFYREHKVEGSR